MAVIVPSLGLAYFPVPKNACSTLKAAFYELNEGEPFVPYRRPDGGMSWIHNQPGYGSPPMTPALLAATAGFERLAVVRDPLRRLISCYKNRVLHHRELAPWYIAPEAFAAAGLSPDPPFDLFIERLAGYRALSWSIRHHTAPQREFLGNDRSAFAQVFRMDELARLADWLRSRGGRDIRLPHLQRGGSEFPDPPITPATRRRMLDLCAADLDLWWER